MRHAGDSERLERWGFSYKAKYGFRGRRQEEELWLWRISSTGDGFEVQRYGHARVALIGFPSVGKSTLLTRLTGTKSEAAAYEFTTLTCIPGVIHYNEAKIQLLDLPGIIEGASEGKGRGRQVIAAAKSSDLILMVLDAGKEDKYVGSLSFIRFSTDNEAACSRVHNQDAKPQANLDA